MISNVEIREKFQEVVAVRFESKSHTAERDLTPDAWINRLWSGDGNTSGIVIISEQIETLLPDGVIASSAEAANLLQ